MCLGIFGLISSAFVLPGANLAADKPAKADAKSKSAKKGKADPKGNETADSKEDEADDSETPKKVVKTDAEWKKHLTPMQFKVTRKKATEPAGTGIYAHSKKDGIYRCVCCGQPLFDSKTKFESGTGWPSFFQPLTEKTVSYLEDHSMDEIRTEVECSRCDAHLGHVFPDGPEPTGMRFCMNSASLHFVARDVYEKEVKAQAEKAKERKAEKLKKSDTKDTEESDNDAKSKSAKSEKPAEK
jgi:peptide-methionine (R)-S-oxide reductase